MQIYPGADLIECEIVGRPWHLPLLRAGDSAMLIDCGTQSHARKDMPAALEELDVKTLSWLIVTHPDGDHCGGTGEIKKQYPEVQIACGNADRALVESPDYLFEFRYDAYRRDHGVYVDAYLETIRTIENSPAQTVVGCHWPVPHGREAIRVFCAESRNFVAQAERLILDYLAKRGAVTLRKLCEELTDRLGEWPHDVHLKLANAFSGHLDRGITEGRLALDSSERPFRYQLR